LDMGKIYDLQMEFTVQQNEMIPEGELTSFAYSTNMSHKQ